MRKYKIDDVDKNKVLNKLDSISYIVNEINDNLTNEWITVNTYLLIKDIVKSKTDSFTIEYLNKKMIDLINKN